MLRLLHDGDGLLVLVELDHAVAFRVVHVVAEHRGTMLGRSRLAQRAAQAIAVEDVVAQHQSARLAVDELLAQQERLGQAVGARLHLVGEAHAVLAAVAQQTLEVRQIVRRADDQDVADPGHHQHAQRIVDHRLVVHGKQLLRCHRGERVKTGSRATGKNDALHNTTCFLSPIPSRSFVSGSSLIAAPPI